MLPNGFLYAKEWVLYAYSLMRRGPGVLIMVTRVRLAGSGCLITVGVVVCAVMTSFVYVKKISRGVVLFWANIGLIVIGNCVAGRVQGYRSEIFSCLKVVL